MTGPLVRKLICATTAAGSIAVTAYLANLWLNAPTLNSMVPPPPANPAPQPQEDEKHASPEDSTEEGQDEESAEQEEVESKEQNDDSKTEDVPPPPPSPPSEIIIAVQELDPAQDQARLKDYIVYKLGEIARNHQYWQQHKTFLLTNWKLYYLDPLLKSIKKYKQSISAEAQNTSNPPGNAPASPGSPSSNGVESGG